MPATDERNPPRPPAPDALTQALRALDADDRQTMSASLAVETRLLAEVRAIASATRRRQWHAWVASAAAVLIAAAGIWVASWRSPAAVEHRVAEVTTGFLPLMYSSVPMTDGHLVRLEVPRMALASFGLASPDLIDETAAPRTVLVDVLVGEDGLARAVRFVRTSHAASRSSRP